ncbi:MAG TPA: CARDB domain-containing protein [Levilinea sp.]|nr:CARDB domain-containing protein [Levilinea sp.]
MNIKHLSLPLLLLAIFFSGCQPQPPADPDPTAVAALVGSISQASNLPDLIVSHVYLGMQGVPTHWAECVPSYAPFEIRAMIRNQGEAPAYNFVVSERSTGASLTIGELGAGQGAELIFPLATPSAAYNLVVDPQNAIPETDEGNNTFSYLAITPTPPVLCTTAPSPSSDLATPVPYNEPESAALSESVLMNITYRSPDWGEFQLQDGIYYRTPPNELESAEVYTTRFIGPIIYGDINADGLEDALVVLGTQSGGTGHFIELAAVLNDNGNAHNVATVSLGDRVVVESGTIENGVIVLNMRVQGPNDGMCCPSQLATWNFVLSGDQLIKLP